MNIPGFCSANSALISTHYSAVSVWNAYQKHISLYHSFLTLIGESMLLRRVDLWRGGSFKQNSRLFRDKTSDLRGEILKVVTFEHIPAAFKAPAPSIKQDVTLEGYQPIGFTGVEIEVYSVRGLERSELGGSHGCPGRLWDRFL